MFRRGFGSFAGLQLGPPLRAEELHEDEDIDGTEFVPEDQEINKENTNAKTPVTFPKAKYLHNHSSSKEVIPLQPKQQTPSSTCPSFWNPGSATRSGHNVEKQQQQQRTGNHSVGRRLPTSSTFPECSPALRVPSVTCHQQSTTQNPTLNAGENSLSKRQTTRATASGINTEPPVHVECRAFPREGGLPTEQKTSALMAPTRSVSQQLEPVPRRTASKPPLDPRKNSQTTPYPKQVVFSSPEKKDVVVMPTPSGDRHFKKLALIGCGGSSKVYKVLGEDSQIYAVKEVYMKHVDPAIKTAYVNEVKLLNKLRGRPEIVRLCDYNWDKQEGTLYLLLEYAEMDLNTVIRTNQWPNPIVSAAYFWNEMLQIVKVIHEEGVIHSDLKPENFVCIGARLKLIDFGIASRIEAEKTSIERDVRCGTINYMAPETIETYEDSDYFKVGRPSDIWSLGCILYLMVYGRTPFEHIRKKLQKWHAITDPAVSITFPDCGNAAVVDVMKRCLTRNPKERATITELLKTSFF